jgi:hypothetical protein
MPDDPVEQARLRAIHLRELNERIGDVLQRERLPDAVFSCLWCIAHAVQQMTPEDKKAVRPMMLKFSDEIKRELR